MIFVVPGGLRRPPGSILEVPETLRGWFWEDFSMIFAGVCRELAGKVRRSPVLLLRGSMGYGDLAKRFKSAAPVVYDGSEAF